MSQCYNGLTMNQSPAPKLKKRYTNTDLAHLIIGMDQKFFGLEQKVDGLDQKFTKQINNLAKAQFKMKAELKHDIAHSGAGLRVELRKSIEKSQDEIITVITDVIDIASDRTVKLAKRTTELESAVFKQAFRRHPTISQTGH